MVQSTGKKIDPNHWIAACLKSALSAELACFECFFVDELMQVPIMLLSMNDTVCIACFVNAVAGALLL